MEKLREFYITNKFGNKNCIYGDDYLVGNNRTLTIFKGGHKIASFTDDKWVSIIEVGSEDETDGKTMKKLRKFLITDKFGGKNYVYGDRYGWDSYGTPNIFKGDYKIASFQNYRLASIIEVDEEELEEKPKKTKWNVREFFSSKF